MFTSSRAWSSWRKSLDKHCAVQIESGLVFTLTAKVEVHSISDTCSRALRAFFHFSECCRKEGTNVF